MHNVKFGLTALAGLSLMGCHSNPVSPIALGPGWNCLATPSAFNGAGVVFMVDPNGAKYTVADYSSVANVRLGPAPNISASKTYNMSAGLLAQVLKIPLKLDVSENESYKVTQSYSGGREANIDQDGANAVIRVFSTRSDLLPKNRYYLVRGALTATAVKYDFDRDISTSFGADLPIKVVTVSPNAKYESTNGFHYSDSFTQPVNVCIEPETMPVPVPTANNLPRAAPASPVSLGNVLLFRSVTR